MDLVSYEITFQRFIYIIAITIVIEEQKQFIVSFSMIRLDKLKWKWNDNTNLQKWKQNLKLLLFECAI